MRISSQCLQRIDDLNRVLDNGRLKSNFELRCIERQLDDLRYGHERGLYWDEYHVQCTLNLFRGLKHYKGPKAGTLFDPEPWQEHCIIAPMFGWYHEKPMADGGLRRFRTAYIEVPRKNGKTFLLAGIALKGLIADLENAPEVYFCATKADQARLGYRDMTKIVSNELKEFLTIKRAETLCDENNGLCKPLSADGNTLDGLNVSYGMIDELHAHKTAELYNVIQSGTLARDNPYMVSITTAGYNKSSICWSQREYAEAVMNKTHEDDAFFAFVATIDPGDDWTNPKIWEKANPNLGVSLQMKNIEDEFKKASQNPLHENEFRRKHLDEWTGQNVRWISDRKLQECPKDVILDEELAELQCHLAFDLSKTRDTSTISLCFDLGEEDGYYFKNYIFAPEEARTERQKSDRKYIDQWITKGLITPTPGDEIDFRTIRDLMVNEIIPSFNIVSIAYDPAFARGFVQNLIEHGISEDFFIEFTQTAKNYNEPCVYMETAVDELKINYQGNPIIEWMFNNVDIVFDSQGNMRPDKGKSQGKIDAIASMLMSLGRSLIDREEQADAYIYGL